MVEMIFRVIWAQLTGTTPCDYTTRHGHDIDWERGRDISTTLGRAKVGMPCRVCAAKFSYDRYFGLVLQTRTHLHHE